MLLPDCMRASMSFRDRRGTRVGGQLQAGKAGKERRLWRKASTPLLLSPVLETVNISIVVLMVQFKQLGSYSKQAIAKATVVV